MHEGVNVHLLWRCRIYAEWKKHVHFIINTKIHIIITGTTVIVHIYDSIIIILIITLATIQLLIN